MNRDLRRTLRALGTIVAVVARGNRSLVAIVVVTSVVVSLLPAALTYTASQVLDALPFASPASAPGDGTQPLVLAGIYVLLLVAQYMGQSALTLVTEALTENGARSIHTTIIDVGSRIEGLQPFEDPALHNRRLLLENNALYLPMNCLRLVTDLFSSGIVLLTMATLLADLHPIIPFLMMATAIPEVLSQTKAHRLRYEGIRETAQDERWKEYYRATLLEPDAAKEVRMYGLSGYFVRKHAATVTRILGLVGPIRNRQIKAIVASRLAMSIGTILPYFWTVSQASLGRTSIGQLVMFMMAITIIHQQLLRVAQTLAAHQEAITVAEEFAAWTAAGRGAVTERARPASRTPAQAPGLRLEGVTFTYPGTTMPVLRDIDLEVPPGQSLAIVGKNGSGKSTLVKLLCRLYDPNDGAVYFDGVDLRDLAIEDLRRSIACVFQDFVRYELRADHNIALRSLDASDLIALYQAARDAEADDMIGRLPRGYATMLGREFGQDRGVELSGGQWQRVAVARGFFRNAGIVIMDEPTATLDVATEVSLYDRFKAMTSGKTTILISHRLATVRLADRIAVLDEGRVAEYGDHESLMAVGGRYREMFTLQAERYRLDLPPVAAGTLL